MSAQVGEPREALKAIDKQVAAQIMQWQEWDFKDDWNGDDKSTFFADVGDYRGVAVYVNGAEDPSYYFSPATNMEDAYRMEERIKELGLQRQYQEALGIVVGEDNPKMLHIPPFDLIHASPEQRCRAALQTVS